jgi:hypothetical protein
VLELEAEEAPPLWVVQGATTGAEKLARGALGSLGTWVEVAHVLHPYRTSHESPPQSYTKYMVQIHMISVRWC